MKSYLEKIGGLVVLATVFLMPLVFIPGLRDCFALPKVALLRFSALVLFAGLFFRFRQIRVNRLTVAVLAYLLVRIITTVFSTNPSISWSGRYLFYFEGTQQLLCFVIFYFAVRFVTAKQIYKSIALAASLAAAYGIIQYLSIDPIKWETYFGSIISTFGNPNFLAGWFVFVLPVLFYQVIKGRYLFLIPVIMGFIALVIANVAAGFIALGASAVFFILIYPVRGRPLVGTAPAASPYDKPTGQAGRLGVKVFLTGLAACMLFAGFFGLNRLDDPSVSSRIIGWKAAVVAIKNRPVLGYGPDTFADEVSKILPAEYERVTKKNANPGYAHNIFLDHLFSSGFLGFLCFLWLLAEFFRTAKNPALKTAVFGGLVFGFFHFWTLEMWLCFWVFLALGSCQKTDDKR
ncbi:MAG: O-antigen ligase family protein [bacterium]